MKTKAYPVEKISEVAKILQQAPALPPKFKTHDEALSELSKHVKDLHENKNYDVRQIVQLLKQNGIKTTLKEVRTLIGNSIKN